MKLLLDTNVLLWALGLEGALSEGSKRRIPEADLVLVSSASLWELAIKRSIKRLRIEGDLVESITRSGFEELPVRFAHTNAVVDLPRLHADPFDRMLIAQAQIEGLVLATADREILSYEVAALDVTRG